MSQDEPAVLDGQLVLDPEADAARETYRGEIAADAAVAERDRKRREKGQPNPWRLAKALARRDRKKAVSMLDRMEHPPVLIVAVLAKELRADVPAKIKIAEAEVKIKSGQDADLALLRMALAICKPGGKR